MAAISIEQDFTEMRVLAHTLGVQFDYKYKNCNRKLPKEFTRNYFCAGDNRHDDYPTLAALESKGFMHSYRRFDSLYFAVTDEGKQYFRGTFKEVIPRVYRLIDVVPNEGTEQTQGLYYNIYLNVKGEKQQLTRWIGGLFWTVGRKRSTKLPNYIKKEINQKLPQNYQI